MAKKIILIVLGIVFATTIGFGIYWTVSNWDAIKQAMDGTHLYTKEDVDNAYDQGYDKAIVNKNEYNALIDQYKATISSQDIEIKELISNVDILTNENTQYSSEISELTNLKNQNQKKIEELSSENETMQEDILIMTAKIEELESQSVIDQAEISRLRSKVDVLEDEKTENLLTIGELNARNDELSTQVAELQAELLMNNSTISDLNKKVSDLEKSNEYYESYIAELESKTGIVAIFEFDGSVYLIQEVDDTNKVNIEDPISTDYVIFNYWMVDNVRVDLSGYEITKTTKFVANVTYRYNVDFVVDEEVYGSQIVNRNTGVVIPSDPEKDKYNFIGWSIDGVNIVDLNNYEVVRDVEFVAIFENKYGLFNTDTGAMIYSWDELIEYQYLSVDETYTLNSGVNSRKLSGDLFIDSDIKVIGIHCFAYCGAISNVVIPEGVIEIGYQAFFQCGGLKDITIPKSVNRVLLDAFNCQYNAFAVNPSSLTNVYYLGSLEDWMKIDFATYMSNPMYFAENLYFEGVLVNGTITIPETVTEIKSSAFVGFDNEFILHNNISTIGRYAFAYSNVESILLPTSLEVVSYGTFVHCENLKSIIIPSSVIQICEFAFNDCYALENIYIPESVELIDGDHSYVFRDCSLDLVIYCEALEDGDNWSSKWNYTGSGDKLEVKYGYTVDQYLAEING